MSSRLPGARRLPAAALALSAALIAAPASAQEPEPGAAAFAARDYERAWAVWRFQAWLGDADGKAGLAMLYDLGLGTQRDPARAFAWYVGAAADGHRDAQLNAGIMADAGIGTAKDPAHAAYWYARAAANGEPRAAFNLGLLYASGTGVPENSALAGYWFEQAAEALPAAQDRLAQLSETPGQTLATPDLTAVKSTRHGGQLDLVWTADSTPTAALFRVEITSLSDKAERITRDTQGSAMSLPRDRLPHGPLAVRVLQILPDAARYAATPWYAVDPDAASLPGPPIGEVRLEHSAADRPAAEYARELAKSLGTEDLSTSVAPGRSAPLTSAVLYRYAEDAPLARDIAAFLSGSIRAQPAPNGTALAPGEIVVRLVGGPASETRKTSRLDAGWERRGR